MSIIIEPANLIAESSDGNATIFLVLIFISAFKRYTVLDTLNLLNSCICARVVSQDSFEI